MTEEHRVYWGSHGCDLPPGHTEPCACDCCDCPDHAAQQGRRMDDDGTEWWCVGKPPYYGPETTFYGEDAPVPPQDSAPAGAVTPDEGLDRSPAERGTS